MLTTVGRAHRWLGFHQQWLYDLLVSLPPVIEKVKSAKKYKEHHLLSIIRFSLYLYT